MSEDAATIDPSIQEELEVVPTPESAPTPVPAVNQGLLITPEPRVVKINQLAQWLAGATANNKNFLIKPSDLKMLYLLVLWDYASKNEVTEITTDDQITIAEEDLVRTTQLFYNNTYYPFFSRIFNL